MLHSVADTLGKSLHSLSLQLSIYKMRAVSKTDGELQIEMIAVDMLQTGKLRSLLRPAATQLQPVAAMWELCVASSCSLTRGAGNRDLSVNTPMFKCLKHLFLTGWDWCFFNYSRGYFKLVHHLSACSKSLPPHPPIHLLNQNLHFNTVPRQDEVI